jgi:hypothetical protein
MNRVPATSFACLIATFFGAGWTSWTFGGGCCIGVRAGSDLPDGIASIMDRDPKLVRVTRIAGDVVFLSYVRPIDNFVWDYRCRIQGNRVVWASEPGRWREEAKDDKVFFEIVGDGKQLRTIADHGDASATKELFERDQIQ